MIHAQRVLASVGLSCCAVRRRMAAGGEQAARQARCDGAAQGFSGPFFEPPDARESPEEDPVPAGYSRALESPEEGLASPDFSCLAFSL